MQSILPRSIHVGIIMDGNGRWAQARGRPRSHGHRAGAAAVRPVVEAAVRGGVGTLTLYAFSSDNWARPPAEVSALMRLMRGFLDAEGERLAAEGVRFTAIGRRDRLPPGLVRAIEALEARTRAGTRLHLRIAVDYSAREAILAAAKHAPASREALARHLAPDGAPDVDLLIRTGGEKRLSDFLLWECAYAELLFDDTPWPEFGPDRLDAALAEFARRTRRFGALPAAA